MSVVQLQKIDIDLYLDTYQKLENKIQWQTFSKDGGLKGKQVSLQYKEGDEDIWTSGTDKCKGRETLYNKLNPLITGTVFESIIDEFKLTRSRFMWLAPWSCYSMHYDSSGRLHIPLITNNQCFMVFKDGVENLPVGWIYSVDTTKKHTAMNGSDHWRLHFIGCLPE